MSKSPAALIFMLVSSLFVFPAHAQERDDSRLPPAQRNRTGTLRELIPGHYVFSSTSFNSGFIATNEGVIVLDALTSEAMRGKNAKRSRVRSSNRCAFWFRRLSAIITRGATLPTWTWSKSATRITGPICSPRCSEIARRPTDKRPGCHKSSTAIT